jgi:hypothetical protein
VRSFLAIAPGGLIERCLRSSDIQHTLRDTAAHPARFEKLWR